MKVISAIVAISAVELLKAFLVSTTLTGEQIGWKIAIHLTFVVSGLLFAASDWISGNRKTCKPSMRQRNHGEAPPKRALCSPPH